MLSKLSLFFLNGYIAKCRITYWVVVVFFKRKQDKVGQQDIGTRLSLVQRKKVLLGTKECHRAYQLLGLTILPVAKPGFATWTISGWRKVRKTDQNPPSLEWGHKFRISLEKQCQNNRVNGYVSTTWVDVLFSVEWKVFVMPMVLEIWSVENHFTRDYIGYKTRVKSSVGSSNFR